MKFALAVLALLGSVLSPALSFSYLDSISKANPVMTPQGKNGPSNGASYLDALTRPAVSAPSGKGIGSYLDNLPKSNVATKGAGMLSYAASLNKPSSASSYSAAPSFSAAPAAPAAPARANTPSSSSSAPAMTTTSGGYLSALGNPSTAVRGTGMRGYLDILPRAPTVSGGAGIPSFTATLPTVNVARGAGVPSYADALSGGYKSFSGSKGFAPSSSSSTSSSIGKDVTFTLAAENIGELVKKLRASGGRLNFSGSIDNISLN
jgi:hypothetical protein